MAIFSWFLGFNLGVRRAGMVNQTVQIRVTDKMEAPIRVYYELRDFYQNHKRYVRSVSWDQLNGESVSASSLSDCIPQRVLGGLNTTNGIINPCGLIAWSVFNDTFTSFNVARGADVANAAAPAMETVVLDDSELVRAPLCINNTIIGPG